jgi:putative ABC transport system permease protein
MLRDLKVVAGRLLKPEDGRSILLGTVLAQDLGKTTGQMVEVVEGERYQVVGIYESFNFLENRSIIMPLRQLQSLMDREGEVTAFVVKSERSDRASLEELRRKIVALAPHLEAVPTREFIDNATEIRMARAIAWMTSTIALLVGTVGMINTMLTAVFERTQELAVLRAIGWRKRRVMRLILLESVILGLAGAVVGTLLAVGLVHLLSTVPAAGRMVAGKIAPNVVLQGFAIAIFVGIAGGLYPACRAALLVPTEGLRHE